MASARPPGHPITEDNQLLCLEPTLQPTGVSVLGERKEREGGLLLKVPMGKVYMTLRREAERRSVAEHVVDHQLLTCLLLFLVLKHHVPSVPNNLILLHGV